MSMTYLSRNRDLWIAAAIIVASILVSMLDGEVATRIGAAKSVSDIAREIIGQLEKLLGDLLS